MRLSASHVFDGLNESQKHAVMTTECPVLIVAGPGTGKTLTIVRRIAYLIHQGAKPENIAAVTFTNRAAREMCERAKALLDSDARKVFIGTFHLLGLRIIKETVSNTFVIYNRNEQVNLLKPLMQGSVVKAQQAAEKISRIKNLLEDMDNGIRDIYQKYQFELQKNSAIDLDDLILKPIEIFSDSDLLNRYRDRFTHIIVDEYQDINPAQYRLLKLFAGERGNICAVGDSDQAIYAFRGADVSNFLNFGKDFKDAKRIALTENYRSTGAILNASDVLIRNNLKRIDKEIRPIREKGISIAVVSVPDEKAEGEVIVREIEQMIGGTSHYQLYARGTKFPLQNPPEENCSYNFSDFAVIFRTNAQAKAIEEAFMGSGIPYQVIGRHLLKRKGMTDIISELKSLASRTDNLQDMSMDEFLKMALEDSDLKEDDTNFELLKNLGTAYQNSDTSIIDFINELSLLTPTDDFDPRADAVTLMTLHMAKGLEFKVVFITGVENSLIPYTIKKDGVDIEEERRLFYVGMTRAKDKLFLIHARNRFLYGQRLEQSPSPFIREIPDNFIECRFIPDRIKRDREDKQIGLF